MLHQFRDYELNILSLLDTLTLPRSNFRRAEELEKAGRHAAALASYLIGLEMQLKFVMYIGFPAGSTLTKGPQLNEMNRFESKQISSHHTRHVEI